MTTTLLLIVFLVTLGLFLRAALNPLRPSPVRPISSEPTAEDYESYLNAMEAAFKTTRIPSFPKTPRKPRQPKPKTPSQVRPSEPLKEVTANIALKTEPGNKTQLASKISAQPHSTANTIFAGQTLPAQESSRVSSRSINFPLSSESHASPISPPSEISVHSRPLAVKNPVRNIRENPSESVVVSQPHKRPALLYACMSKLKQAINWSKTIFAPVLQLPKICFGFFARHRPKPPPPIHLDSGIT